MTATLDWRVTLGRRRMPAPWGVERSAGSVHKPGSAKALALWARDKDGGNARPPLVPCPGLCVALEAERDVALSKDCVLWWIEIRL